MLVTRTSLFLRSMILAALFLTAGCETIPVQEMSDARQAISAARDAGAETYAVEDLRAAERFLASAEQYLNSRNYATARRDALEAKAKAIDALRRSEASQQSEN